MSTMNRLAAILAITVLAACAAQHTTDKQLDLPSHNVSPIPTILQMFR